MTTLYIALLLTFVWLRGAFAQDGARSGFVNVLQGMLDYRCPDDLALSGVASDYFTSSTDRRWEFQCTSAGGLANVSLSCSLLPAINAHRDDMNFDCPNEGYLAGLYSEYSASENDRVWRPYCCTRPFSRLVDCVKPASSWENILRENLNFTAAADRVIAGVESFYFNRDRRWRFKTCALEVDCGDPGLPTNADRTGDIFLYNSTVSFTCDAGYYQSSGAVGGVRTCLETGLWSDSQPVCSMCTSIANCADVHCTTPVDQSCYLCSSNTGPGLGERAFTNRNTSCQPRCSWLDTFCYPGMCPDLPSTCNCSTGFTGQDCLQISEPVTLDSCTVTIQAGDGSEAMLPCQPNTTVPLVYTNIVPQVLTGQWEVIYNTLTQLPPKPAYVGAFLVGVAVTEIRATLHRAADPSTTVSMTTHPCEERSITPDTPVAGSISCSTTSVSANISNHTFLHGDILQLQALVKAGGYLDILNLDMSPQTQRHYYSANPTVGSATFVLDLRAPMHCSLVTSTNCLINQIILGLSGDIVTTNEITVMWGGWLDSPSQVESYELNVHYLEFSDGFLTEGAVIRTNQTLHTGQVTYSDMITLPREGPYSFILRSHDLAGNTRLSRRTLLYDFNSSVEINPLAPLFVSSAVPATDYSWQNSTNALIVVSGISHFHNTNLRLINHLAPLANYSLDGVVEGAFDQPLTQGRYPREGTDNALGIVELRYALVVDHEAGNSSTARTPPLVFPFETLDLSLEAVTVSTPLIDGDSLTVWLQAIDFRGQFAVDSVLVHIDSSPPELSQVALNWNGVNGLSLHGTGRLLDLNVQFQTWDEHSGVFSIEWSIVIVNGTQVGSGRVPVPMVTPTSCHSPRCICDPLNHCTPRDISIQPPAADLNNSNALHDTDYIVTVTVTNHARLTSELSHRFTVDTTPPLQGYVIDGSSSDDIDHQMNFELSASWSGFFDRETDVAFYQYTFSSECSNSSTFVHPLPSGSDVVHTTVTMATWTAPSEGTYFVTVVAYNQALQSTNPVCSDGVTVDTVAPEIKGIVIPGAIVQPGLVRDVEGVWFVRSDRVRVWVGDCPNVTTPTTNLAGYPIGNHELSADVCTNPTLYSSSQLTLLPKDSALNISWVATDNVGISHYEVTMVTEADYTANMDHTYYHTAGQSHYSFHSPELLHSGSRVFVSLRAYDHVRQLVQVDIGTILIDVTPPSFNGSLEVVHSGGHVIVTWDEGAFSDSESGIETLEFAIGSTEYGIQVSDFNPVPLTPSLQCYTASCVAIETTTLPLISGLDYYITVRATDGAGLSAYVTTVFTHMASPPSLGYLLLADSITQHHLTSRYGNLNSDAKILIDPQLLVARWGGFVHPNMPVNFSVALGTNPGSDDVVPFVSVGMATHFVFDVNLTNSLVYYATVKAQNRVGVVNISSQGTLVLRDVVTGATVFDGPTISVDSDYLTRDDISANWEFPAIIADHISHYQWSLKQVNSSTSIVDFTSVGNVNSVHMSLPPETLKSGLRYLSAVKACFTILHCTEPVFSNGFHVCPSLTPGTLTTVYTPESIVQSTGTSSYGTLELTFDPFTGPEVSVYEWSLGNAPMGRELVIDWSRTSSLSLTVMINATLSLDKPNHVTLRGYSSVGLYAQTSMELVWNISGRLLPQNQIPRNPPIVFDITQSNVPTLHTDNWKEIEHHSVSYTDIDYIGLTEGVVSLSAAWPTLLYTRVQYSISTQQQFTTCEDDSNAVFCGTTISNAVTATNLNLIDSQRYYFCVQGIYRDSIHPTPHTPPTLTHCSDGVTVDLRPPTSSCVQITTLVPDSSILGSGSGGVPLEHPLCGGEGVVYQVSQSELVIVWAEFSDGVQSRGLADYQYAIGTSPGATDIADFTSVGVATYAIAKDLSLTTGLTYYATVRGIDFVGHFTDGYSQGVIIDTTPPELMRLWIEGADSYISTGLRLRWELPWDRESGVESLEWALGNNPGSSDVLEWSPVSVNETELQLEGAQFRDGQTILLSLKVTNGAGLSAISSSLAYTLDHTPPVPGIVYDGPYVTAEVSDLDYSSDLSMLSSHWAAFTDPHTGVTEYFVAMGTASGVNDIQPTTSVGLATTVSFSGLTLTHGVTYYTTVTACNALGLCLSALSNGITVDVTPPTPGRVINTLSGPDIQFQASRSTLTASWVGFHDDESSIQNFIYHVGFFAADTSLLPPTQVPPTQMSFVIPVPTRLPTNTLIYTTVVAVNGAGVKVQATSGGLYIDSTPPQITSNVTIDTKWAGSVSMETQYSTSALRAQWQYLDNDTSINQHFWSLLSDSYTSLPIPAGRMVGSQSHTTATNLNIQDGDTHRTIVIGCNQASLCTHTTSPSVLFDSSPPVDGYFAVSSATMATLNRTVPGGMTWRNMNVRGLSQVNLAFLGFTDPHSGINEYWVAVGTEFGGFDLMMTQQPEKVEPTVASEERGVLMTLLELSRVLMEGEILHISMWAINGVGLKSHTVRGSFTIDPPTIFNNNGTLTLLRSSTCPLTSCLGHCACGARGQMCMFGDLPACQPSLDLSQLPPDRMVTVRAISRQLQPGAMDNPLLTALTDTLEAEWELPNLESVQYLEWNVAEEGSPPCSGGVVSNSDWLGVDNQTRLVFPSPHLLRPGATYVFCVRAWYNETSFGVFISNSITVDTVATETVLGRRVRTMNGHRFISDPNIVTITLQDLFSPSLSRDQSVFQVAIGDSVHADNVLSYMTVSLPVTHIMDLDLKDRRSYYITARAISPLGIITTSSAHPLSVDLTPPTLGHMFTGSRTQDLLAQTNTTSYSSRWLGFTNSLSGINHYELALTDSEIAPTENEYIPVRISLRGTLNSLTLIEGQTYYPHLVAISGSGVRSQDFVLSRGLVVDSTPPVGLPSNMTGDNILSNPSFEGELLSECPQNITTELATSNWTVAGEAIPLTLYDHYNILPYEGCSSLLFIGSVRQTVATQSGVWYRVVVAVHQFTNTALGRLSMAVQDVSTVCNVSGALWSSCQLLFMATNTTATLQLHTPSGVALIIDATAVVSLPVYQNTTLDSNNTIRMASEFIGQTRARLQAYWSISDPESGIKLYQWAIGTVSGGQQLQSYQSTGGVASGTSSPLPLMDGEDVYVTVIATNHAGLTRVFHSQAFIVDHTPPLVSGRVLDGVGEDRDYQSEGIISADWSSTISDAESGFRHCVWAIGSLPGATDIQPYRVVSNSTTSAHSDDLSPQLPHGTTVYSIVHCLSGAGRYSNAYSDGVTILMNPPNSSSAVVTIDSPEMTQYDIILGYLPSNRLTLYWSGFFDEAGTPLYYQLRVTNSSLTGSWENLRALRQISVDQLPSNQSEGVIQLRAVNLGGVWSEPVNREFIILSTPPLVTGGKVNATWLSSSQLQLDWTDKFSSPAPLRYEISLGSQRGSGSIRMWAEFSSEQTSLILSDPRLMRRLDYYLSLTAISASGLHTTMSQVIAGIPLVT